MVLLDWLFGFLPFLVSIVVTIGLSYVFYPAINLWLTLKIGCLEDEDIKPENNGSATGKIEYSEPVLLSVVIPAYNEENRLPIMLDSALSAFAMSAKLLSTIRACCMLMTNEKNLEVIDIEWIVVNDGSSDATAQVFRDYVRQRHPSIDAVGIRHRWRLLSLLKNGGKGAAVRAGMLHACGQLCLMADADGATEFGAGLQNCLDALLCDLDKSQAEREQISQHQQEEQLLQTTSTQSSSQATQPSFHKNICVFGSRAHLEKESTAKRSLVRTFLMKAFHIFVSVLCSSKVRDSQCGFKLFPKQTAQLLFGNLHLMRWAFDTELLVMAELETVKILEVAVPWHEVDGSKLNTSKLALLLVSIAMLRDMLCVRLCYSLGIWKLTAVKL